jgi:hypothetical protein
MKIGMITDSLGAHSFDELLDTSAELGIERLEFAAGTWSQAPPLALDRCSTARRCDRSLWPSSTITASRSASSTDLATHYLRA